MRTLRELCENRQLGLETTVTHKGEFDYQCGAWAHFVLLDAFRCTQHAERIAFGAGHDDPRQCGFLSD